MDFPHAGVILLTAALSAAGLIAAMRATGIAARWLDQPVERSLHAAPTPRVGGLAIGPALALAWAVAWAAGAAAPPPMLATALMLVFAVSVLDDWRALPAGLRLAIHLFAALLWAVHLWGSGFAWLPAALALAWMANLYNFMDGADGLAGCMALVGFATLGMLAGLNSHPLAVPALAACGAAIGFLVFNFPPARVFMGDAGSVPLGFLAAALGLWGVHDGLWTLWVPALAFAPFIADASLTLIWRVTRGRKPWQAHREHLYQCWVLQGWTHRRLLIAAVPLMLGCATLAALLQRVPLVNQTGWGVAACLLMTTIYIVLRLRVARAQNVQG